MKKLSVYFLVTIMIGALMMYRSRIPSGKVVIHQATSSVKTNSADDTPGNIVDPCDQSLWQHVYHSSRLEVIQNCITVTGVVEEVRPENDGDEHILLRLDSGQQHWLNAKNLSEQNGDLVLEAICVKKVTQDDAVGACSGYLNNVHIPKRGEKISATGAYVLDHQHGWNEIHPVTLIISTGSETISPTDSNPVVGHTAKGQPIYLGPRGGRYHYSSSGNKVYEKAK